jgi:hypothetical protein
MFGLISDSVFHPTFLALPLTICQNLLRSQAKFSDHWTRPGNSEWIGFYYIFKKSDLSQKSPNPDPCPGTVPYWVKALQREVTPHLP